MTNKKQITQEIIDWSNSAPVQKEYFQWKESLSFAQACDKFYNLLTPNTGSETDGVQLASGTCYYEDEINDPENFHLIFSFQESNGEKTFYKIPGYYNSWDGVSWEDAKLVKVYPETVTIVRYSTKKPKGDN
jgi:hypothetical protein